MAPVWLEPEYRLLGPHQVRCGEQQWSVRADKQRALLALLLLRRNEVAAIDHLVDEIWATKPPRTARNVLQGYAYQLRRRLGADQLTWESYGYRLRVQPGQLDIGVFEDLAAKGRRELADRSYEAARETLGEALALWRGPALADIPSGPRVDAEVMRLTGLRQATVAARAEAGLQLGLHQELSAELTELTAEWPMDEELHRLLMISLYRAGRAAEALERYSRFRQLLLAELAIEPGPELRELQTAILNRSPSLREPAQQQVPPLGRPSLGEPAQPQVPPHSLGEPAQPQVPPHSLGEPALPQVPPLSRPSLGEPAQPHSRPAAIRPAELPPGLTDFIGREEHQRAIVAGMTATQRPATPIALICGDPGVGKSSLAIHVGHQLRDHYPDGQLYVDLRPPGSPYLSPGQALVQLLSRLGVSPETIPVDLPARASLLRSHLAERAVLLVLDNAISEEQVSPLLPGGTECGVLLTSRRPLGGLSLVASELLQRLSGPESSELLGRLIGADRVEREPDQAKRVVELCEGLPLALRICGARLAGRPGLDIRWLADRLADERRRLDMLAIGDLAIRSNLDLSFQLLDADEQSALRLLALPQVPDFAPWFAAAVLGTKVADAEDRLERLVESRLLACDPSAGGQDGRYRFHHLIRIYAGERAAAEEPADQREVSLTRAAALCLTVADELRQGLRRTVPKPSSDRKPGWRPADLDLAPWSDRPFAWFESERPVLIGVIRQLAAADHASLSWDLATSLDGFLDQRGWLDDWYAGHTAALAAARRGGEVRGTAWVLRSLGELMLRSDRYDEAVADLQEAAEIFRRLGDHVDEAHALRILSAASRNLGNYPEALRVARAAVAILRTDGPPSASAEAWQCLGLVHRDCGRPAAALRCFTRALTIFQQQQEPSGQSRAWSGRGTALGAMGDTSGATHAQLQAVRFAQQAEHRLLEAYTLCRLGEHYVRIDRGADAIPQLQQGLELCRQMGDLFGEAMALCTLGEAHLLVGARDRSVELLRTALNLARELGAPLLLARTLVRAGDSAAATDDDDTARQYWREALELFQQLGVPGGDGAQERLSGEAPAPRRQAQPGGGGRAVPA